MARTLRTFAGALYTDIWFFPARSKSEAGTVLYGLIPKGYRDDTSANALAHYVAPLYWCPKHKYLWFEMYVADRPRAIRSDLVPVELWAGIETCAAEEIDRWEMYGGKAPWKVLAKHLRRKDGVGCAFVDAAKLAPIDRAAVMRNDAAALRIAREIDQTGDFTALPILADALEESGGVSPLVLEHCRKGGAHHAGCWVIERVLSQR